MVSVAHGPVAYLLSFKKCPVKVYDYDSAFTARIHITVNWNVVFKLCLVLVDV